ncbi:MAG: SIS domain-containing protein [Lentisphaerae bacterium]|nr:MAG: SIS domain-containing protein [Lentisphaerota bacterium]
MSEFLPWEQYLVEIGNLLQTTEITFHDNGRVARGDMQTAVKIWCGLLSDAQSGRRMFLFCGNGASAAMADHFAADLGHHGKVATYTFSSIAQLTAQANDSGYESVFLEPLTRVAQPGDVLICISSSGKSENILNAARFAVSHGIRLVTFSGFHAGNPLRTLGMLNFYVNAKAYGPVESAHAVLLHYLIDCGISHLQKISR